MLPGLVVPTFTRIFLDEVLIGRRDALLQPLLIGMGVTAAVRMALTWLQESCLLRLETKLALTTSSGFFGHILRLPISYFSQRYSGEIGSRVAINDKVAHMVAGRLASTALDCLLIVFYAVLMALYDFWMTLLVIGIALGQRLDWLHKSVSIGTHIKAMQSRMDRSSASGYAADFGILVKPGRVRLGPFGLGVFDYGILAFGASLSHVGGKMT